MPAQFRGHTRRPISTFRVFALFSCSNLPLAVVTRTEEIVHDVAYDARVVQGNTPAMTALMSGEVAKVFDSVLTSLPQV